MITQRISRKIVKTALACIMLFGILLLSFPYARSVPPEDTALPFHDVDPTDWFYEQVRDVFEQGLMTGTGDITFSPGTRVTRAMAVQALYNHSGWGVEGSRNLFTDVAEEAWYHDAVTWAWRMGIARGFGDGTFAPSAYITRAHLVVLLDNYVHTRWLVVPTLREGQVFVDYMDIRDYAKEAIDRFFRAMVINGRPDGRFDPQGNATRAELATMLSQFVRYSENWDVSPPVPPYGVFPEPPPTPEYGFPYPDHPNPEPPPSGPLYGFPCSE